MKFVQAQFSLKYEPQIRIRRSVNDIEDFLQEHYGAPQTVPMPDDFAAEAPRIILTSKNGHSQISFSQISVDFTVHFDGEFSNDFELTKDYILERIGILKNLLQNIGIDQYYFCGISYNMYLDTKGKTPIEYMKEYLTDTMSAGSNIYEISQRTALVEEDKFFVNQQVGTYKEFQGKQGSIPNLLDFKNSVLISEGVNLVLDVNNRYEYLCDGAGRPIETFQSVVTKSFELIEKCLNQWR